MKCKSCGKYVDAFEWPQEELIHFRHDLCYDCFKSKLEEEEREEDEESDPNTDYGLPEIKIDPELDDAPDLGADDDLTNQEELEEIENEHTESESSPENESIQELTRMLFGGDHQSIPGHNLSPVF